ncbi:MAG: ADP-ribosylglycohydrolase family protein [Actinomycetota bacterium]
MLPTYEQLRTSLTQVILDKAEQGHITDGLATELGQVADSYDDLRAFAHRLRDLPVNHDWPYVEPVSADEISSECDPDRVMSAWGTVGDAAERIRAAFFARVSGCMLGKPFEIFITIDEIETALASTDGWPLTDYPTEAALRALPTLQGQWRELARERIAHVAVDDDINYTVLAMQLLERRGAAFTHDDMATLWMYNLPVLATFGPERTILLRAGFHTLADGGAPYEEWVSELNPGAELCGALIRADAYGYACLGDPEQAARLAQRDASFTHQRTGVYGPMFIAATIAITPFVDRPLDAAREGLRYVPQRSRFAERTRACLEMVDASNDWREAHARIRERFGEYGFCRIYQEIGTVLNTLAFARDAGDGICIQVMQGNDTDSFGATAGSILGAFYGAIDERWTRPFKDRLQTALATFHESSLSAVAERMAALPTRIAE